MSYVCRIIRKWGEGSMSKTHQEMIEILIERDLIDFDNNALRVYLNMDIKVIIK